MKHAKLIATLITFSLLFIASLSTNIYAEDTTLQSDEVQDSSTDNQVDEASDTTRDNQNEMSVVDNNKIQDTKKETQVVMTPLVDSLQPNEVVVSTFAELKTAVESNVSATTIYLKNDITLTASITIPASKAAIEINGTWEGVMHTLTERKSSDFIGNFYIGNATTKSATLKNIKIIGYNYYGPISVSDSQSGVDLYYDNVEYSGPQISYNTRGTVHYKDTSILITSNPGSSTPQEVGEVAGVEFLGNVNITHSSTNHIFWFRYDGEINFANGANVIIDANTTALEYGSKVDINLNPDSSFTYNSMKPGFTSGSSAIRNVLIGNNAMMNINFSGSDSVLNPIAISGNLTLDNGANLNVNSKAPFTGSLFGMGASSNIVNTGGHIKVDVDKASAGIWTLNNITLSSAASMDVTLNSSFTNTQISVNQLALGLGSRASFKETGGMTSDTNSFIKAKDVLLDGSTLEMSGGKNHRRGIVTSSLNVMNGSTLNYTVEEAMNTPITIENTTGKFALSTNSNMNVDVKYANTSKSIVQSTHPLLVDEGTSFHAIVRTGTYRSILSFTNGTLQVKNPKSFSLSGTSRLIEYSSVGNLSFEGSRIRDWIAYADPYPASVAKATYSWNKDDDTSYSISGTLASGVSGELSSITSSYPSGVEDEKNPSDVFKVAQMHVISVHEKLPLTIDEVSATNKRVKGTTDPNMSVLLTVGESTYRGVSDENGAYEFNDVNLDVEEIEVEVANDWYAYDSQRAPVESEGVLAFKYVPTSLLFETAAIQSKDTYIKRQDTSFNIEVEDTRSGSKKTNWSLYVSANPFMSDDGKQLKDGLVYIDEQGKEHKITTTPTQIYEDTSNDKDVKITWDITKGLLVKVHGGEVFKGATYRSKLNWTLVDAP